MYPPIPLRAMRASPSPRPSPVEGEGELRDFATAGGSSPLAFFPLGAEATLRSPNAPRRTSPLPLRERDRVRGGFGQPFAQDWSPPAAHAIIRGRA